MTTATIEKRREAVKEVGSISQTMKNNTQKMEAALETTLGDLHHLKSIINLCGAAAEMRRTLNDLDSFKLVFPEQGANLEQHMESCNEWREHEDVTGVVLKEVSYQVGCIIERIGEVI